MSNNFPALGRDQIVDGIYRLGTVLHESATRSLYETEFGDHARPAVIAIRRLETGREDLTLRWGNGIELAHPNLLRVYASGHSVVDGIPVSYLVMERAEESLGGVLAERSLSEAETREMLSALLSALRYLHRNGYAHSNLKPSNILAVGDYVKLSSEDVTPVGNGVTPAEDMRALGAVIVQALTQKPPRIEDAGPFILREASQTFTDIVRHCLDPDPDKRWTVDQVQARLDSSSQVATASVPAPVQQEASSPRTPKWIYAALAALLLIVALVAIVRNGAPPVDQVASVAPAPAPASNPAPPAPVKPEVPGARASRTGAWSVIVAAYKSREPAEKRSGTLSRKWPNFKWTVFQQSAGKPYYLVLIGQNLSEDQAQALRDRAVASGLPRDTYIKKLP